MKLYLLLPILAIAFVVVGCSHNKTPNTNQTATQNNQSSVDVNVNQGDAMMDKSDEEGAMMEGDNGTTEPSQPAGPKVVEFDLTVDDGKWDPGRIAVRKGTKVILHITSVGSIQGIGIDDYPEIDVVLPNDVVTDVEFTADKAGAFAYYCNHFCDPKISVNGIFEVKE